MSKNQSRPEPSTRILQVAIPTPLRRLFDYLPPLEDCPEEIPLGTRILVPFRNQKKIGIIVQVSTQTDYPLSKLKHAYTLLDRESLFPQSLIQLIEWASRYYQAALGEVFEAALPLRLRKESAAPSRQLKKRVPELSSLPAKSAFIPSLNEEQHRAVQTIQRAFGTFKTFLLNGITGSGKTEVYIRLIQEIVASGKQVLLLVPEINLTPQLIERFRARFTVPIISLNSSLTEKNRHLAFEEARTGRALIVIGTRSAAFVPLKNPGLFIIDEEHDPSFKQQEKFRYHARDLMIMRASLEACPILLGTATPSLETLHNAQIGRYENLQLLKRAGNASLPTLRLLDVRHKKLKEGLSFSLLEAIQHHLEAKGQVLIFLNRRGYAPVLMCFGCDWIAHCHHCDAKMTFHRETHRLQCHHCDSRKPLPSQCPACQEPLNPLGIGTERVEEALKHHFPHQTVLRIDSDTTRKKGSLESTLDQIHRGDAQILLGTQMIAKGHHFPNVTLVAILEVDQALFSTDFRSLERMGQMITQVAGRAGRESKPGQVLLQTCHPQHPLLTLLLKEGYLRFANALLAERRAHHFPPFSYQALLRADAKTLEPALHFLTSVKKALKENGSPHLTILGPVPAPMERRQGKHRAQLLIQTSNRAFLQAQLAALLPFLETSFPSKAIRWSLDVDPIEMA